MRARRVTLFAIASKELQYIRTKPNQPTNQHLAHPTPTTLTVHMLPDFLVEFFFFLQFFFFIVQKWTGS